jgi:hypothetical protein
MCCSSNDDDEILKGKKAEEDGFAELELHNRNNN